MRDSTVSNVVVVSNMRSGSWVNNTCWRTTRVEM